MPEHNALDPIFNPQSIAVIGASRQVGAIGNIVTQNLIDGGYPGALYPINPGATEICGRRSYPSVSAVPGPIDLAVFCVPEKLVLALARDCAQVGVKGYVVITSGFSEVGNHAAETELCAIAREGGGRVIGPNIVGILMNPAKANASFAPCLPFPGRTALVSQSGALLVALDLATHLRKFGTSSMVSLGNMADLDFADCINYFARDEHTACITLYIEGVKDGRRFIEAGRRCNKPIIAIKAGISEHGAKAAASHTGSLAGAVKIYDAAFKQAHVIRAATIDELLDCSQALSLQPPMRGGQNIVVITNGGGIGVLSADAAEQYGIPLHVAPAELQAQFRTQMPEFGSAKNPVDITGGAGAAGYEGALELALRNPWVHAVAVLYCETAVTKPMAIAEAVVSGIAKAGGANAKPVVACFVGGEDCQRAQRRLLKASVPLFAEPAKAMAALAALRTVARFEEQEPDEAFVPFPAVDEAAARRIIGAAREAGRSVLTEPEAKAVFAAYGLPVTRGHVATNAEQAVEYAVLLGYPVVMKVVSPDILHKSDAGGVKVHLRDEAGVRAAYKTIMDNSRTYSPDADIHGVLIQVMAPVGREVIVGSVNDPQFGPTIMFGLGGIFVEVLKDVTFRVAPFSAACARAMLPEIKSYKILQGARGEKRRDIEKLAEVTSRMSQLVSDLGDEIAETDANPIMLYEEGKGLKIVDARIILRPRASAAAPRPAT